MALAIKASRYNFYLPLDRGERCAVYNALTGGFAIVEGSAKALLERASTDQITVEDSHDLRELRRGGFLAAADLDERDVLEVLWRRTQADMRSVGLTITPTLACNLACTYCYESNFQGKMTKKVADRVVDFVEGFFEQGSRQLGVTWYGGEPLLALDVMEYLSRRLRALVKRHRGRYRASIITNGTRLTEETVQKLVAMDISFAQVTLDGPPTVHDARRPFRSGGGSFEQILQGLPHLVACMPVSLRVNVDRGNKAEALAFADWLRGQPWFDPQRVFVNFGYVRKLTPSCGCSLEEILEPGEYWQLVEELETHSAAQSAAPPAHPTLATGCTATSLASFVIGPQGELYRCWNHVGDPEKVVGRLGEVETPSPLAIRYLLDGCANDPECRDCKVLPLCAGGCVEIRIQARQGLVPRKDCSRWRYALERQLMRYLTWWAAREEQRPEASAAAEAPCA